MVQLNRCTASMHGADAAMQQPLCMLPTTRMQGGLCSACMRTSLHAHIYTVACYLPRPQAKIQAWAQARMAEMHQLPSAPIPKSAVVVTPGSKPPAGDDEDGVRPGGWVHAGAPPCMLHRLPMHASPPMQHACTSMFTTHFKLHYHRRCIIASLLLQ